MAQCTIFFIRSISMYLLIKNEILSKTFSNGIVKKLHNFCKFSKRCLSKHVIHNDKQFELYATSKISLLKNLKVLHITWDLVKFDLMPFPFSNISFRIISNNLAYEMGFSFLHYPSLHLVRRNRFHCCHNSCIHQKSGIKLNKSGYW